MLKITSLKKYLILNNLKFDKILFSCKHMKKKEFNIE